MTLEKHATEIERRGADLTAPGFFREINCGFKTAGSIGSSLSARFLDHRWISVFLIVPVCFSDVPLVSGRRARQRF